MPEFKAKGFAEIAELFEKAAEEAGDIRRHRPEIVRRWQDAERDLFQTRGRGTWPTDLRRTLRLERSMTEEHHPDAVREVEPDQVRLGTRVPYAEDLLAPRGRVRPEDFFANPEEIIAAVFEEALQEVFD